MSFCTVYKDFASKFFFSALRCSNPASGFSWSINRQYSRYPPSYIEPIYIKEELEVFQSGEAGSSAFFPVKAARNDSNSSVFHDPVLSKFINIVMKDGDKLTARGIVETAFCKIKQIQLSRYYKAETEEERSEIELNPVKVLHKAIENSKPILQLTPIKRSGTTYQVPVGISDNRAQFLAMKWFIAESQSKDRKVRFHDKLAKELIDAANNTGSVVKRKQDLHRQCEANRAYAHYRWG